MFDRFSQTKDLWRASEEPSLFFSNSAAYGAFFDVVFLLLDFVCFRFVKENRRDHFK